nr:leaf rust 10 disease-resistance locus receptor-like protein kinase-like 1.1 [Tanacetum cinerariifolium]
MNINFVFTFVILSCLPDLLHSATSTCPKSFSCQNMIPFKYPFYNATNKGCGLIKVNCISNHTKEIRLGKHSYVILPKVDYASSVTIHNKTFEKLVNKTSCEALMNNFTSPRPLLYSISITPFITLFKCTKNTNYAEGTNAYFNQPTYYSYNSCKDHNFYYKLSVSNRAVPSDLPHACQVIQLPVIVAWNHSKFDATNIFSLISPFFSISIQLTTSCSKCNNKGGQCDNHNGQFQCLHPKKEKLGGYLILITVLAGFAFILCPIIFLIRRLNKNSPFWYMSSKGESRCLEEGSIFFSVSVFSYAELEDATKTFDPSQELGGGGFGTVYYGKLQDGREVAVKRLYDHNYNRVQKFINEVEILTKLRHTNLVVLYGCTSRISRELLLVYDFGVVLVELISSMVAVDLNRSQDEISLANLALNRIQTCELDQLIDHALVSVSKGEMMAMMTSVAELAFRCLQYHSEMRPTMNEVLDVLRDIQREGRIDDHDRIGDLETVKAPPPFETTDMELLLKDFPPSPVSINSEWQSDIKCDKQHNEVLEK